MTHIITLSLLIIAVIVIRAIFRGSVSPKMIYALWLVVLLKLCMPFSIFDMEMPELSKPQQGQIEETQTAIESSVLPYEEDTVTQNNYLTDFPDTAVGNITEITPAETGIPEIGENAGLVSPGITPDKNDSTNKSDGDFSSTSNDGENTLSGAEVRKISIASVLKSVWLCGSAVFALWFAFTNAVFSLSVRRDRRKVGKYKGLKVYVSEKVGTPCLRGIIPSVYLTPKAFDCDGRRLILAHEYTHLCHGDNIWSFVRIAAIVLLWWNPLIWIAAVLSKQDAELACDYALTKKMNDAGRINYARVIIDMLPVKRSLANGFANGSVKERVFMMTKKNKNKILSALLALVLILAAVGCSFIGITEKKAPTYDANDFFPGGEIAEAPEAEYYNIISNGGGFEIKQVVINDSNKYYHSVWLEDDIYLYLVDSRAENGTMKLYLVDISAAELLDSKTVTIDSFPSQTMYRDGRCIIYNMHYDTEKSEHVVECAYDVSHYNGELICLEKTIELFPYYERIIVSPDGSIRVGSSTDDVNGHGGMDIIRSDGSTERIASHIMLDDDIGGKKAGIGDVTGYTPFAFIDDTRFVYRIGGWEWQQGYGIYDTATGEKTEFLEGKGLQAVDAEGNFYVWETSNYEPQNIWKIAPDGTSELIATYSEDDTGDLFNLKDTGISYTGNGFAIVSTSEDYKNNTYRIYSPDLKSVLAEIKEFPDKGTTDLQKIIDNTLVFVTFANEIEEPPSYKDGITLYTYDGEEVKSSSVTDAAVIEEILSELRLSPSRKITELSPESIKDPIYSLRFEDKSKQKTAVWTNGYFITDDGAVFEHDINMKKLSEKYFSEMQSSEDIEDFCGLGIIARAGGVWNSKYMAEATFYSEGESNDNIELEVLYLDDNAINVIFRNNGSEEWTFGTPYDIHAYVDGEWYDIPDISHSRGMIDSYWPGTAYIVYAGEVRYEAYSLPDLLPDGKYRIAVSGLTAEFEIDSDREAELTVYEDGESPEDAALIEAINRAISEIGVKEVDESGWSVQTDHILFGTEQKGRDLMAYVYMAYQLFIRELNSIKSPGGLITPAKLNFVRNGLNYELQSYSIADTPEKIEEYFPKELTQKALNEKISFELGKSVYCGAMEYFADTYISFDDELIIDGIFSNLTESADGYNTADPLSYLDTEPKEYLELLYYDKYTLSYIFKHFLAGGQDGTRGELLRQVMIEITGWESSAEDSPQEYFTSNQAHAVDLYNLFEDKAEMKDLMPNEYLLASLTHAYFDYYDFTGFIPNENAVVVKTVTPISGNPYIYLCKDRSDEKKIYVYYTRDFGRTIGYIDIKLPTDIEYDAVEPIYSANGAGSGEVQLGFALKKGDESVYILYDNFDYSGADDWHIFKYRGIADETFVNENIAALIMDQIIIEAYKERRGATDIDYSKESYSHNTRIREQVYFACKDSGSP